MKKLVIALLLVFGCSEVEQPAGGGFQSPQSFPDPKLVDVRSDSVWTEDGLVWVALEHARNVDFLDLRAVSLLDHNNDGQIEMLPFGGNPDVRIWQQCLCEVEISNNPLNPAVLLDSVTVQYRTPSSTETCCGIRL